MAASDSRGPGSRTSSGIPLRPARGRARRGSIDRPIDGGLVRGSALLILVPLLVLALTTARPGPLPAPALPASFDGSSATALALELARDYPDRAPGSPGANGAAAWVKEKLDLYGLSATEDAWDQTIPGLGRVRLRNLVTVVAGSSSDAILVVAHRDNTGTGPGLVDNASGAAVLIELARGYGRIGTASSRAKPQHTLVFLSSDGGAYGGFGAERFAAVSPLRRSVRAVVSLDALAGSAEPRLELAGFGARSPAPALVRTADVRVAGQIGHSPAHPGWLTQIVNLGVPFGYGEQAPFLGRRISAIRLSTASDRGGTPKAGTIERLDANRFVQLGRAADEIVASLDGGIELAGGTAAYLYLGNRIVRGWTLEFLLLTSLIPFLVGAIDLFARSRRRRLPFRGAWRALRTRFGLWLWIMGVVALAALVGVFPRGLAIPPPPGSPAVTDRPVVGLIAVGALALLGFWRTRRVLAPQGTVEPDDVLAGYAVALLALGVVGIATAVISPYGTVFVLPSLYAWLWLPQVAARSTWARDLLFGLGLIGPALAAVAVGTQLGLGLDAPLYLVSLMTLGFIPWTTALVLVGWAAIAGQLGALAAGRYAPVSNPQAPTSA